MSAPEGGKVVVYWRCSRCEVIEMTSPLCQEVVHTHVLEQGQTVKYNLLACRTMTEPNQLKKIQRLKTGKTPRTHDTKGEFMKKRKKRRY